MMARASYHVRDCSPLNESVLPIGGLPLVKGVRALVFGEIIFIIAAEQRDNTGSIAYKGS